MVVGLVAVGSGVVLVIVVIRCWITPFIYYYGSGGVGQLVG